MSGYTRYPSHKTSPKGEEAESPVGRSRSTAGRWVRLALVVGLLTLFFRLTTLGNRLVGTMGNPILLAAAMQATSDHPLINLIDEEKAQISSGRELSGMQARALSAIARSRGQLTTAEVWLIQGMADRASAYLSQFELCLLYWNEGQRAHAREACRGTKASLQYWLNRGYDADDQKNLDEALDYYDMATAVDPDSVRAWYVLGRTLFALERYKETVAAYEHMMALNPTPPADVYEALGWSYLKLGRPEPARVILDRGLMVFPDRQTYYLAMADVFRAEGDLLAADSWYARMLQRWPDDVRAWSGRGEVAIADNRPDDAIDYYQKAAEGQPQGFGYWLNLASTAWAEDNISLANEAYRQALALQPDNPSVLLQVGRFYAATKQVDEAKAVFEHILQLQPGNDEAADQLAAIVDSQRP